MCEEYHEALMTLLYVICPFCEVTLRVIVVTTCCCCDNENIVEDSCIRRCTNCDWFEYPFI